MLGLTRRDSRERLDACDGSELRAARTALEPGPEPRDSSAEGEPLGRERLGSALREHREGGAGGDPAPRAGGQEYGRPVEPAPPTR
jgi:hypothetical protein